jgi:8-oxo-dGTP pyrophosphatase MutT (NUDIX family)/broad specificity phosphatase PhoE
MTLARAAGAVVHRKNKKGVEFLVVHRPRYDDWSLPKGHLDSGETYESAAAREVEEETGFRGELGTPIGAVGYSTRRKQKVVRYWLLEYEKGKFKPNGEVDAIRWLPPRKARRLVSYTRDANVIGQGSRILTDRKTSVVHLVRHANAGQRSAWKKADHKRPLSKKGERQATTITHRLLKVPITSAHTSYYRRCVQTLAPLADRLDVPLQEEPALAEGEPPERLLEMLRSLRSESVVLCSHGDVISGTIGKLAAEGVDFDSKPEWKKASVWTLDLRKGRIIGGSYTHPPSK